MDNSKEEQIIKSEKENEIEFYPSVKKWISPSAFSAWHNQKSSFVKSYFQGIRTPSTTAMKAGTKIHKMIELGFLPATYKFDQNEAELKYPITDKVLVFGKPDSHEVVVDSEVKEYCVSFVDYKTGKKDTWSPEKLAVDLKMKVTAWLVWKDNDMKPIMVKGILEWIGTKWNEETREIEPTGESACYEHIYTAEELKDFEKIILSTIVDINTAYIDFLQVQQDFELNHEDVTEYAMLYGQIKAIETQLKVVKERVMDQSEFSGKTSFKTDAGTFSITARKKYTYPDNLVFGVEEGEMTLVEGVAVAKAMAVAKKNFELENEPSSISKSVGFRPKK